MPQQILTPWLPGFVHWPDPDFGVQRQTPNGLVIHCGSTAARTAESAMHDGRNVSYTIAWKASLGELVQMVSLLDRAYHAGPEGNDWWGLCMPGPWDQDPRPTEQLAEFTRALWSLQVAAQGGLKYWCRHSDIKSTKVDPGPGFDGPFIVALERLGVAYRPEGPRG